MAADTLGLKTQRPLNVWRLDLAESGRPGVDDAGEGQAGETQHVGVFHIQRVDLGIEFHGQTQGRIKRRHAGRRGVEADQNAAARACGRFDHELSLSSPRPE